MLAGNVLAQHPLIGTYNGTYIVKVSNIDRPMGLALEISAVDGNAVKGKATRMSNVGRPTCNGNYPMAGTLKGDALDLRSTKLGGPTGECRMRLRLAVDGNKLVGTMNGVRAELSK